MCRCRVNLNTHSACSGPNQWFSSSDLQSACWSVLEQDTEPQTPCVSVIGCRSQWADGTSHARLSLQCIMCFWMLASVFKVLPVVIKTHFRLRQEMFSHPGRSVCRAGRNWTSSLKTFHLSSKSLLKVFKTCGVLSQCGESDSACYEPNNPEEQWRLE